MLSFHLLILPHDFQSQHFPGMRVGLLISLCVSYLGVQPTISHAPSSAKSVATPQHQMTHFLNSLGGKIKKKNDYLTGLSLRAGGRGLPPATTSVAPGYLYWKRKEN